MKAQWTLTGQFRRISLPQGREMPPNEATGDSVDLLAITREVQAIATHHYGRSPRDLKQSYGLAALSESTIVQLLQQANPNQTEAQLYQVPALRWLRPTQPQRSLQPVCSYGYQFISQQPACQLNLLPNDLQLPSTWQEMTITGSYTITLVNDNHSDLPSEVATALWHRAQTQWSNCASLDRLHWAIQSSDIQTFSVRLLPQLRVWLTSADLSEVEQVALTTLRQWTTQPVDLNLLSQSAKDLVSQFQMKGRVENDAVLRQIAIQTTVAPLQWIVGRGDRHNRATLEGIITEAQRFLLISSYVIEDERITRLICDKAATLPEGVWVLTDLRNEVVNFLDQQVENGQPSQFERSHEFKRHCLIELLNAGVHMRSGKFHLKTMISDQSAYLGSCNLTGGSLALNLEAGLRVQQNALHAELLQKFQQCWTVYSQDVIYQTQQQDGLILHSAPQSDSQVDRSPHLLSPKQYYQDLQQELDTFRGKVAIYSRSFKPGSVLEQRLSSSLYETRLFLETDHLPHVQSKFHVTSICKLHAKVTLLGDRIAYVGGVNFNFEPQSYGLVDLMYKTSQPTEIQQLHHALARFS